MQRLLAVACLLIAIPFVVAWLTLACGYAIIRAVARHALRRRQPLPQRQPGSWYPGTVSPAAEAMLREMAEQLAATQLRPPPLPGDPLCDVCWPGSAGKPEGKPNCICKRVCNSRCKGEQPWLAGKEDRHG